MSLYGWNYCNILQSVFFTLLLILNAVGCVPYLPQSVHGFQTAMPTFLPLSPFSIMAQNDQILGGFNAIQQPVTQMNTVDAFPTLQNANNMVLLPNTRSGLSLGNIGLQSQTGDETGWQEIVNSGVQSGLVVPTGTTSAAGMARSVLPAAANTNTGFTVPSTRSISVSTPSVTTRTVRTSTLTPVVQTSTQLHPYIVYVQQVPQVYNKPPSYGNAADYYPKYGYERKTYDYYKDDYHDRHYEKPPKRDYYHHPRRRRWEDRPFSLFW